MIVYNLAIFYQLSTYFRHNGQFGFFDIQDVKHF